MPAVASWIWQKHVGRARQVLERELEEQRLAGIAASGQTADFVVVFIAMGDGMIEDGGVRGQAGDRKLLNVALQRAAIEQFAGDVVEPKALSGPAQFCRRIHSLTPSHSGRRGGLLDVTAEVESHRR